MAKIIPTIGADDSAIHCDGKRELPAGVRITNACVSAPIAVHRARVFFTGRSQQRFVYELNAANPNNSPVNSGLALTEKTLGDCLKSEGYANGWKHLPQIPLCCGFAWIIS